MKKKTLLRIFLIPILIIVLMQGTLPFVVLVLSGAKDKLENNNIQMDSHAVENRQVVLENEMVQKWSSVSRESQELSDTMDGLLARRGVTIQQFLSIPEVQQSFLGMVFPILTEALQYNTASGIFLILANDQPLDQEEHYQGFFIRDSDPQNKIASNADLLLERGNKELSQKYTIPLDSPWTTDFTFAGYGKRACDDFFYKPYMAAREHMDTDMKSMGYWSKTFILEDHYMDNHQMITYSVPLLYDGEIYGILGVEISTAYLSSYFSVKDLSSDLNAGYALLVQNEKGQYESIVGKGALYDKVSRYDTAFEFVPQEEENFYEVVGDSTNSQKVYAIVRPLSLYGNNVPYDDTEWILCGFVTENSIYGFGKHIYEQILLTMLICTVISVVSGYLLIKYITKPINRLMNSIRGGVEGIRNFQTSNILEIDELHDVIENLTNAQLKAQDMLMEEKERYRIAVETSQDMFFTFRKKDRIVEIVNNADWSGTWDCKENTGWMNEKYVHPDDRDRVANCIRNAEKDINIDFRMRYMNAQDYIWVNLYGSVIQDELGESSKIVGCVHNIQHHKDREEQQRKKQFYDPVTSFYRMQYGLEALRTARKQSKGGVLALLCIEQLADINNQYGLTFGDVVVEQLAKELTTRCEEHADWNMLGIRAGASYILIWLPEAQTEAVKAMLRQVREHFAALTNEKYLELDFKCGITCCEKAETEAECIGQTKTALESIRYGHKHIAVYQELSENEQKAQSDVNFDEVVSLGRMKQISISSLALNLFGMNGEVPVVLDMLALKLEENYNMSNLLITQYNREYQVNSVLYCWRESEIFRDWDGIIHCNESQYRQYIENKEIQEIQPVTEELKQDPTIGPFIGNGDGLIFHMTDQGGYSGSILFFGIDAGLLSDEVKRKHINEIGSIIQNKINLQRHDQSAKAKADFLARMSHEIRTPMNGIIGMTEIALKEGQSEERRIDCLKKIEHSSNYLLGLINDILDMSKIESGKMKLVLGQNNLMQMIRNLEPLLESRIAEKNIHFSQNVSLQHEWFLCDELRINQVLVNLLSNAIKYSNEGGHVKLTVTETCHEKEPSQVYFAVQDDGIGIPKEKQSLIFQRFEQADNSEKARKQGTGLGLAISSRLVHMMDADIELESEPGKGSLFSFTIKISPVIENKKDSDKGSTAADFSGRRILVVEDNLLNMEIARTILEECGILVEEAHDGREALERMQQVEDGYYDMVLMDIMMPVMDGLESTRAIRNIDREYCRQVPIIAMSANAFDEDVRRSLASGMNGHLSKPVNVNKLKEMLVNILV